MWSVLALLLTIGASGERIAPDTETVEVMRREHLAGKRHYERGEIAEALAAFERAQAAVARPELLFNVGQCQRRLGRTEAALASFRAFLSSSPPPPREQAARVQRLVELLEKELAAIPPRPPAEPAGAVAAAAATAVPPPRPSLGIEDVDLLKPTMLDAAAPPPAVPVYRRPWFWGAVVGVAAASAATAIWLSRPPDGHITIRPESQ